MENDTTKALNKVIRIDEAEIRGHLDEMVRGTVEETLNALLDAEADEMCKAPILLNEKCLLAEAFCLYGGSCRMNPNSPTAVGALRASRLTALVAKRYRVLSNRQALSAATLQTPKRATLTGSPF